MIEGDEAGDASENLDQPRRPNDLPSGRSLGQMGEVPRGLGHDGVGKYDLETTGRGKSNEQLWNETDKQPSAKDVSGDKVAEGASSKEIARPRGFDLSREIARKASPPQAWARTTVRRLGEIGAVAFAEGRMAEIADKLPYASPPSLVATVLKELHDVEAQFEHGSIERAQIYTAISEIEARKGLLASAKGAVEPPESVGTSERLAISSTGIYSDAVDFRVLLESGNLEQITEAVHELKPQAATMISNALSYVTGLEGKREPTEEDSARGEIAVRALKDCWQEILLMLRLADDSQALEGWTLSIDAILAVSATQVASEIAEAKRLLTELSKQLSATPESREGSRRLVNMLPSVARIVSTTSIAVSLGAIYSDPVKSFVCTVIAATASEATRAGIDTWQDRDPFKKAYVAHELLAAAVLDCSRLTKLTAPEYWTDRWVADARLRFALHGTQTAIICIDWRNKILYRITLDDISGRTLALALCHERLHQYRPPPKRLGWRTRDKA